MLLLGLHRISQKAMENWLPIVIRVCNVGVGKGNPSVKWLWRQVVEAVPGVASGMLNCFERIRQRHMCFMSIAVPPVLLGQLSMKMRKLVSRIVVMEKRWQG